MPFFIVEYVQIGHRNERIVRAQSCSDAIQRFRSLGGTGMIVGVRLLEYMSSAE